MKFAFNQERLIRMLPVAVVVLMGVAILASVLIRSARPGVVVTYQNRPLDAWFYGARTNFFHERTRSAAQSAFAGVGADAFPFLLAKLESPGGSGVLYANLYQTLPAWAQLRLPYPVSADDTRVMALNHLRQLPSLPPYQVQSLANAVQRLRNPRVKLAGFQELRRYQTSPAFLPLCRAFLEDENPSVQLQGAIELGLSALGSDPKEPRVFPILLAAYEQKALRKALVDLRSYDFQQWPPGTPRKRPVAWPPGYRPYDPAEALKEQIEDALLRLRPYLTAEQKESFRQAERAVDTKTNLNRTATVPGGSR